jgi:hypothetical protein
MLLPGDSEPDKRLSKLIKNGLLRVHKGLPGNRSIYQLSKKGAAVAGVSPARGRVVGTQALVKNLGVLLFCHVPGKERHRIELDQLSQALGAPVPDGAYCVCRMQQQALVFDCYVPGPQTPVTTIIRHMRKMLKAVKDTPVLATAVKDLRFGFVVLVPTAQRRKAVMDAVRTKAEGERLPLIKRVRVWVEIVDELAALFGTAGPSLGRSSAGASQTLLFPTE